MTDKDNSLEGMFYRRMSRLVPKFFHARLMDAFRKVVERHREEGDGRLLSKDPEPFNFKTMSQGGSWFDLEQIPPHRVELQEHLMRDELSSLLGTGKIVRQNVPQASQFDRPVLERMRESAQNPPQDPWERINAAREAVLELERKRKADLPPTQGWLPGIPFCGIHLLKVDVLPSKTMALSPDLYDEMEKVYVQPDPTTQRKPLNF